MLAWLWTPGETEAVHRAVATDVDLSVSSGWQLDAVRAAAAATWTSSRASTSRSTPG